MFADARIKSAVETIVTSVDVPPMQWHAIAARIAQPQPVERRASHVLQAAVAAAACLAVMFVAFPASSLGLVRIVVSSYQDVIKVIGWTPPAGAPKSSVRGTAQADAAGCAKISGLRPGSTVGSACRRRLNQDLDHTDADLYEGDARLGDWSGVRAVHVPACRRALVLDSRGSIRRANGNAIEVYVSKPRFAGRPHGAHPVREVHLAKRRSSDVDHRGRWHQRERDRGDTAVDERRSD